MVKMIPFVALLALAGCAHMPEVSLTLGQHLPCSVFSADGKHGFEPDRGASGRWTDSEMRQLKALNGSGAALCGWKPPGGR